METLILIGVILLIAVLCVDCIIRVAIVWSMRKRKRAVKPLDVVEGNAGEVRTDRGADVRGRRDNPVFAEGIEDQDGSADAA